jgi:hypothetical protein
MPLKACVNHKDPEFYFAHMQFFSEIDRCATQPEINPAGCRPSRP